MGTRTKPGMWASILLTIIALGALAWLAVLIVFRFSYGDPAPSGPPLPPTAGFRDVDGDLQIWLGPECQLTEVMVIFRNDALEPENPDSPTHADYLILSAPDPGVTIENLKIAQPDPAFTVTRALPENFRWQHADEVVLDVVPGWSAEVDVAEIVAGSVTHPEGTFYFGEFGWQTPGDIQRGNGGDWLTLCASEPQ